MTDTAKKPSWINRFGLLSDVLSLKTKGGKPYVRATLTSIGANSTFVTKVVSFNDQVVAAIKDIGNGGFISLRGEMDNVQRDNGKFSEPQFKAMMVNEKKAKPAAADAAPATDAPVADAPVAETPAAAKPKRTRAAKPKAADAPVARKIDDEIPF